MPELPEVETIARDLRARLVGERVTGVDVRWPGVLEGASPEAFRRALVGQVVCDVGRRGKFLVVALSGGGYVLAHLRMTGQFLLGARCAGERDEDPHVHLVIGFGSGESLCYRDVRKFGRLYPLEDPDRVLGSLGPEPLDPHLTPASFAARLGRRRRRLKDLLLDQSFLAGLGNIYVDESLWRAQLSPRRIARDLTAGEATRLLRAIRATLASAIVARGTTFSDYRDPQDRPGANRPLLAVYGRAGEPCLRCGAEIVRTVVGGRGTHVCPACQGASPASSTAGGDRASHPRH